PRTLREAALSQRRFNEIAMPAGQIAEGIQRLHHAGPSCPAGAGAAGESNHGYLSGPQSFHTQFGESLVDRAGRVKNISGLNVLNGDAGGKPVLRQADAPAPQIGLDAVVLHTIEAMLLQQIV